MPDNKEKTVRDLNPLDMKVSTFKKWGIIIGVLAVLIFLAANGAFH